MIAVPGSLCFLACPSECFFTIQVGGELQNFCQAIHAASERHATEARETWKLMIRVGKKQTQYVLAVRVGGWMS
jgi:hypothetical protein